MNRLQIVLVRAYWPSGLLFLCAAALAAILATIQPTPLTTALFPSLKWMFLSITASAFLSYLIATFRLWRWDNTGELSCPVCVGPLGFERAGRYDRGGSYRKCYSCGRNVNHKHYEQ